MKSFSRAGSSLLLALALLALSGCACLQRPDRADPTYLLNYAVKVHVSYEFQATAPDVGAPETARTSVMTSSSSGSGTVFCSNAGRSLVLTAGHVCDDEDDDVEDSKKGVTVQRVNGGTQPAKIIWKDLDQDLCVLAVDAFVGPAAPLGQAAPALGATVYFPGAPLGLFGNGAGFLGEGRYAGPHKEEGVRRILVSGHSALGASGSGIFASGRLIGVLLSVATESGFIVAAAEPSAVRAAVSATQSSCVEKASPAGTR